VEHHPPGGDAGLEHLGQVPGDGLALAILIGGEIDLVRFAEGGLEPLDHVPFGRGHDVRRLEVLLDVYREALGVQVSDRADGRLDDEVVAQEPGDGASLGRRLDDHERRGHGDS
jgi:hypothetical protein